MTGSHLQADSNSRSFFGKDCGATTGFNTRVSVSPANGEAFSADEYPPFVIVHGRNNVFVTWTNDASISVVLPSSEKVFKKLDYVGTIVVTYNE